MTKITVCSKCLQESCWQGEFYCEEYKTAGTVEIEVKEGRDDKITSII